MGRRWRRRLSGVAADLTSAHQLANRAQDQFDALKAKADTFLEQHPWGTEVVSDDEGWILRVNIPQQPPERWWMDLGEMADNARAALNHLAFQLVIDSGNDPNKGRVQFPIFEVEQDYLGNGGMNSNREKMLAGIAKRHRKLIDDAQPYKLGSDATQHPLSVLRSLTDRHKHRERHVGAMALDQITVMAGYGDPLIEAVGLTIGNVQNTDPLVDQQVLHRVQTPAKQPEPEIIDTPVEMIERGRAPKTALYRQQTSISSASEVKLTVAFFGDRAFKIDDIGSIPPYVLDLIERFERRIVAKRPRARPTR